MTHRARFRLNWLPGLCVASLAFFFFVPARAGAQNKDERERFYENTHVLRRIFFDQGYQPITGFAELEGENPENVILFLLDSSDQVGEIPGGLIDFVRRGGAVLIASSRPPSKNNPRGEAIEQEIQTLAGVRITGQTFVSDFPVSELRLFCYNGKAHCPVLLRARDLPTPFSKLFRNPRGQNHLSVYVNDSSCLVGDPACARGSDLATLEHCIDEQRLSGRGLGPPEDYLRFAVGGEFGKGRYLVLANDRLFINRMMLPPDTGNVEFAQNCLLALEERANGKRTKILFVEYGKVNSDFKVPLKEFDPFDNLAEIFAAGLLELGRRLPALQDNLARAEERDDFHRGLWRILDNRGISGQDVMRWILLGVSSLFGLYGFRRIFGSGRHRMDPATPLLPRVAEKHQPREALFAQRQRAMLENDNLWEAAHDRARATLLAAGVPEPRPRNRRQPKVQVRGGWWQRWQTRRRALRLWRLAFDPLPQLVPKSAWDLINHELNELKTALASGAVRFV